MKDALAADPDLEQALPLDPFGSQPQWASRIAGLGGFQPPPDPSYVFLTLDSRPALGVVTAHIRFHNLTATCGTLLVEVRARSAFPGADYARLETIPVNLAELAASGAEIKVRFRTYMNAYYVIAGSINDTTDITSSHISITIDRRATPAEHGSEWGWRTGTSPSLRRRPDIANRLIDKSMTDLTPPSLADLLSQPGTPVQCRESEFDNAMAALRRDPTPNPENWSFAYILNAVERFSESRRSARILGYVSGQTPLLSYFAAQEHEVVGMEHAANDDQRPDPGRALRELLVPQLCDEADFFAHAHFTTGDIRFPPANFSDQFDILWSMGANRLMTRKQFMHFAVSSLANVKPNGLAIHVFDYTVGPGADQDTALLRQDIEHLALLSLSHGNDVVRLRFRHGAPSLPDDNIMPFGLVMLRGGPLEG